MAAAACPQCGVRLETPLACEACGALLEATETPTPFEVFGLVPAFSIDARDLRQRLLQSSRRMHPDFYAGRPEEALAEKNTAILNQAHATLSDDFARADWLLRHLGGPSDKDERAMPQSFLMEVMEWNETLEEARGAAPGSPEREALAGLGEAIFERRSETFASLSALLEPLPAPGAPALREARQLLNVVRYLERALEQLEEERLDSASS